MPENQDSKRFDLEDRTFKFAVDIRKYVKSLPKSISNIDDVKQLVRSSGSIGANYIEANESFSKKDFYMRIKICRKEAKETRYWLRLLDMAKVEDNGENMRLIGEVTELMKIFGAIITKAN